MEKLLDSDSYRDSIEVEALSLKGAEREIPPGYRLSKIMSVPGRIGQLYIFIPGRSGPIRWSPIRDYSLAGSEYGKQVLFRWQRPDGRYIYALGVGALRKGTVKFYDDARGVMTYPTEFCDLEETNAKSRQN